MSFILDALRKSESERQRDARPSVMRIPGAVEPPGLPTWAAGTMMLLGVGVLALATAWWLSARTSGGPGNAAASFAETPGEPAVQRTPTKTARAGARAAATATAPRDLASARAPSTPPSSGRPPGAAAANRASDEAIAIVPLATVHTGAPSSGVLGSNGQGHARAAPGAGPASSQAPAPSQTPALSRTPALLGSYADLAEQDPSVPKLRLEFRALYSDPARRFVFINGRKYVEGETLKEGPRLVRITKDGAVLAVNGRQLLLSGP